jgi:hypothetical protein
LHDDLTFVAKTQVHQRGVAVKIGYILLRKQFHLINALAFLQSISGEEKSFNPLKPYRTRQKTSLADHFKIEKRASNLPTSLFPECSFPK